MLPYGMNPIHSSPYVVTGVTGQVGGVVARVLLGRQLPVRAVLRSPAKGAPWQDLGCELAIADFQDTASLAAAFAGARAVFVLAPPVFDPSPGFAEASATGAALKAALEQARPERVVYLSTIGAQSAQTNLLSQHTLIEGILRTVDLPITFLRPAWFMENASWDVPSAKASGRINSFLQPLDRPVPMVATQDIGATAAEFLQSMWTGHQVVELEGPARFSPRDLADAFNRALRSPVEAVAVERSTWSDLFRSQGMKHPEPRMAMLDGFNAGWIDFEGDEASRRRGSTSLQTVIDALASGPKGY